MEADNMILIRTPQRVHQFWIIKTKIIYIFNNPISSPKPVTCKPVYVHNHTK